MRVSGPLLRSTTRVKFFSLLPRLSMNLAAKVVLVIGNMISEKVVLLRRPSHSSLKKLNAFGITNYLVPVSSMI
mgnify:CR=1 FL=1